MDVSHDPYKVEELSKCTCFCFVTKSSSFDMRLKMFVGMTLWVTANAAGVESPMGMALAWDPSLFAPITDPDGLIYVVNNKKDMAAYFGYDASKLELYKRTPERLSLSIF
jgi:hypothetical protein